MTRLVEVFGITTSVPTYTYVDRAGLDGQFEHFLHADRHVVIYGASKQGKTSLRRKQLPEQDCIVVPCKPEHALEDLYREIRRQLGAKDLTASTEDHTISGKGTAAAKGGVQIPFVAKAEAVGTIEAGTSSKKERTFSHVTDEGSLVALSADVKSSGKRIIIEDFHYLSEEERNRLAFDLKAFWDLSVFFIVIGVWAEQNLLTVYNNDLNGRVEEIDIRWELDDLQQVVNKGEVALNVLFDQPIKDALVNDAAGNVGLLQRLAEKICMNSGISGSASAVRVVDDLSVVEKSRDQVCASQENRYHTFIELVGAGFKDPERTKLRMYHHLVRVCYEAGEAELLSGISRQLLLSRIQKFEPNANMSVLSAALSRLNRLQSDRKIFPPVIAYNNIAKTVALVDRELLFFRKHTKRPWPWDLPDYDAELAAADLLDPKADE
jgi:hypothetical protein